MVDVPATMPVTSPVVVFTVATMGLADVHTPPVTVLLSVVVPAGHTVAVPVMVPADVPALMVTVINARATEQPVTE